MERSAYSSALPKDQNLVCSHINPVLAIMRERLKDSHQLDGARSPHSSGLCQPELILPYFGGQGYFLVPSFDLG